MRSVKLGVVVLILIAISGVALWASGSWGGNNIPLPWVWQTNTWYHSADLTAPAGVTSSNVITSVGWQYYLTVPVPSAQVWICVNHGYDCANITGQGSGSTQYFNGKYPANAEFNFLVRSNTGGSITVYDPPVGGGQANLFVNYQ